MNKLGNLLQCENSDKIALVDTSGPTHRSFTFAQLNTLANVIANVLTTRCKPKDKIAILSYNSAECIAAYLGILKLGATVVFIDANLTISQIEFILKDSRAQLLLSDGEAIQNIVPAIELTSFENNVNSEFEVIDVEGSDPALILYTSGSSGSAKGVIISNDSHYWAITKRGDLKIHNMNTIVAAPMFHMSGLSHIGLALAYRSKLILMPRFNTVKCIGLIQQYKIHRITAVPTMMALMLNEESIKTADLSSVIFISTGAAAVSQSLFSRIRNRFPKASIIVHYGSTEAGPGLFVHHPNNIPTPDLSVGYPNPNIQYRLVDGVLQIRSPTMMSNYTNGSKSITDDGFFITNDLFRIDEAGFYYFVGRADDMFVCGGDNIYPKKIEDILESFPPVLSATVVGIEDEIKGVKPYAFVVLKNSADTNEKSLIDLALSKLTFNECPRRIWILEEMPLLASNKINKVQLKEYAVAKIKGE